MSYCCFQYACSPMFNLATCDGCKKGILPGTLRVRFDNGSFFSPKWYHFDCFWKHETTANCTKDEIMLVLYSITDDSEKRQKIVKHYKTIRNVGYISLEGLDRYWPDVVSDQEPEDIERIREHIALDREEKTSYYTPSVDVDKFPWCPKCRESKSKDERSCLRCGHHESDESWFSVRYKCQDYAPERFAKMGVVNIDAKDFAGYDRLDENEKKVWDKLFKKKDDTIFFATDKSNHDRCGLKNCLNFMIDPRYRNEQQPLEKRFYNVQKDFEVEDLRIQHKLFSYHPQCFTIIYGVNIDGKDVLGYDQLQERNKMILNSYIIKSADFYKPTIEKSTNDDYCDAVDCLVSQHPSKYPWPCSIKKDELLIRYHGRFYHPKCFQASGKSNTAAKNMKNYQNLTDEEKQTLDGIFKKAEKRKLEADQSNVSSKENEEPSTKKNKSSEHDEGATEKNNVIEIE